MRLLARSKNKELREKILEYLEEEDLEQDLPARVIAKKVATKRHYCAPHVKYMLNQLEKEGKISIDRTSRTHKYQVLDNQKNKKSIPLDREYLGNALKNLSKAISDIEMALR